MTWLRTLIVHPFVPVTAAVAFSYVLAAGKDSTAVSDVGKILFVIALAPILSAVLTYRMLRTAHVSRLRRAGFVALAFGAGVAAAGLGFFLWYDAIEIACDGRYECPL